MPAATTFKPSKYQEALFQFIQTGQGHAMVEAVAGAGKTTSLVEAAQYLPKDKKALFLAFNVHIAKPLGERLRARGSTMECSTIHSLGRRVLAKNLPQGLELRIEDKKYRDLARSYLAGVLAQWEHRDLANRVKTADLVNLLTKLTDFARLTLTDPTVGNLLSLISHFDLPMEDIESAALTIVLDGVAPVLAQGIEFFQLGQIDFTDMIWLPTKLDFPCPQYDFVFCDEAQDLNNAQRALVQRCCKYGRMVFVADRRQALYGFAGADTNSVQNIIDATGATTLPLSICYRCGKEIVKLAQQVTPIIEYDPTKPDGEVQHITVDDFWQHVKPGDMVLCRTTAPLVERCLALLRKGIKAVVRGKDIGKTFVDLLQKLSMRSGFRIETVGKLVEQHRMEQLNILSKVPDNEMKVASLNDRIDTFVALYEAYLRQAKEQQQEPSIYGLQTYFETFFKDEEDEKHVVTFSTVHKAKGLECERVFIIEGQLMPHPAAKKDWQLEQEFNILYVAITRAKQQLIFVGHAPASLTLPGDEQPAQPTLELAPVVVTEVPNEAIALPAASVVEADPTLAAYLEAADTCPGCGEPCDLSGQCCWSCGLVFNHQAVQMQDDVEELDLDAPVEVTPTPAALDDMEAETTTDEAQPTIEAMNTADLALIQVMRERAEALEAEKHALEAEVQRLRAENERLRRLAHHGDTTDLSEDYEHTPNHLKPKLGRTKKEGAQERPEQQKGTGRRQPLQLSLDPLMVAVVKSMKLNCSGFFEEQVEQWQPYQEAKEMYTRKAG